MRRILLIGGLAVGWGLAAPAPSQAGLFLVTQPLTRTIATISSSKGSRTTFHP